VFDLLGKSLFLSRHLEQHRLPQKLQFLPSLFLLKVTPHELHYKAELTEINEDDGSLAVDYLAELMEITEAWRSP